MNHYSFKAGVMAALVFIVPTVLSAQTTSTSTATSTDILTAATTTIIATSTVDTAAATSTATTTPMVLAQSTEERVRAYFADVPVMAEIANCESRFRQFDSAGNPLNGGSGGMIGLFQIHGKIHRAFALTLGFDIDTVEGNMGYARYLYQQEGTQPWISSFPCWNRAAANPERGVEAGGALSADLTLGMIHPEVTTLQRLLNAAGYTVAADGPGSPGNETNKFGAFTKVAVKKFQCEKLQVCSGDEYSTGYGYVGARTRAALLSATPSLTQNTQVTKKQDDPAEIERLTKLIAQLTEELNRLLAQKRLALAN